MRRKTKILMAQSDLSGGDSIGEVAERYKLPVEFVQYMKDFAAWVLKYHDKKKFPAPPKMKKRSA